MQKVNIHEAKTRLSRLVEAVESGETVVLARAGTPVAKLVPLEKTGGGVRLGTLKDLVPLELIEEIDEPLSEAQVRQLFAGGLEP